MVIFFFKQKTAYEMRISDWSSDVCSSDLNYESAGLERVLRGGQACGSGICLTAVVHGTHSAILSLCASGVRFRCASTSVATRLATTNQIGRASCRESVCQYV